MSDTPKKKAMEYIIFVIVIVVFTVVYFGFYYPYALSKISFQEIVSFPYRSNEWFEGNAKIINNFREGLIAPNDELTYEITYQNKKLEDLLIESKLEILFGGKVVNTVTPNDRLIIPPLESHSQRIIFHPQDIGENQIRLVVSILNSTDYSVIDTVPGTINIDIVSFADALQRQANSYTFTGLLISAGVGGVTAISLIFSIVMSNRHLTTLKEQNEILKKEIAEKFEKSPELVIIWQPKEKPQLHTPELSVFLREPRQACGEPTTMNQIIYNRVVRRHLRVIVENDGERVAKGCTATMELISRVTDCQPFSEEPKTLRWASPIGDIVTKVDIAPYGGKQALDVAFYDECGYVDMPGMKCAVDSKHPQLRAFVADPVAYKMHWIHLQDGFCQGKFKVKLTIYCENTKPVWKHFIINIPSDWHQFTMEESESF